jgi:hypothetical protein
MAVTAAQLQRELWTSWASMLRVYAAAHGLTSTRHAVVEVSADEIILRVDPHWSRFTRTGMSSDTGAAALFALNEDGTVTIGDQTEEMDLAAERVARAALS